jgi:hypothetical protein
MIAIVTLSTTLQVVQDFTADRDLLLQTIDRLSGVEGMGFEELAAADATDDTAAAFAADDSEFTLFNTDRRLEALKALCDALGVIDQKKSLIYFSSGMTQTRAFDLGPGPVMEPESISGAPVTGALVACVSMDSTLAPISYNVWANR